MTKILQDLVDKEREYLNVFFSKLDLVALDDILQKLSCARGLIIVTGVGKSGLIAKKIAVTLTSTGTRALYLSPTDAMHGDLGIVQRGDVLVALSKSGESDELVTLVPFLRSRGAQVVAVTSNRDSRLALASDYTLELPVAGELCPFNMAPTVSTVCQTIVGDLLAIALMRMKNLSLDDYAKSHPAGRIGKRITVKVSDLMLKDDALPLCAPKDVLVDVLVELSDKKCGCLLVVDVEKRLLGIFTDGDLRRSLQTYGSDALQKMVQDLMTPSPRFLGPDVLAWDAMRFMEIDQKHPIMVLPVLEEGKVVGLIKMHDIVQAGV